MEKLECLAEVENLKAVVFREDCSYRQTLVRLLDGMGLRYQVLEFDSLDSIITCVSAGIGITLLPNMLADLSWIPGSVAVHELGPDQAELEIVFVRRRDRLVTSALTAFLEKIQPVSEPRASQAVARYQTTR